MVADKNVGIAFAENIRVGAGDETGERSTRRGMPRAPKKTETTPTVRVKRTRRATDTTPTPVTEVEISRLAYQIYEARGRNGGSPLDDWLEAERQLTSR